MDHHVVGNMGLGAAHRVDGWLPKTITERLQGYLAHEKQPPRTVALCLGTYCGPRGVGVSYERGTPVVAWGGATPTRATRQLNLDTYSGRCLAPDTYLGGPALSITLRILVNSVMNDSG